MKYFYLFVCVLFAQFVCSCGNSNQSSGSNYIDASTLPVLDELNIHLGVPVEDVKSDLDRFEVPGKDLSVYYIPSFEYFQVGNITFTADNGYIDAINIWDESYSTNTGLSVGSSLSDVMAQSSKNTLTIFEWADYNYIKKRYEEVFFFYDLDNGVAFAFLADQLTQKQREALLETNPKESCESPEPNLECLSASMFESISSSLRVSWIYIQDFDNQPTYLEDETEESSDIDTEPVVDNPIKEVTREVTLEGTVTMWVYNNSDSAERVYNYVETDWMNTYLAYILELDKSIDVTPYLMKSDLDFLYNHTHNCFMIEPTFDNSKRFAQQYANKRVRITGMMYVPAAGWRNVTEVVLGISEIDVLE